MKIIISPAKKMVTDMESLPVESIPVFIDHAAPHAHKSAMSTAITIAQVS